MLWDVFPGEDVPVSQGARVQLMTGPDNLISSTLGWCEDYTQWYLDVFYQDCPGETRQSLGGLIK